MQNIVDWKSCASVDTHCSSKNNKQDGYPLSRDGIYSTTDVVFPKLFHEQDDEGSSVITMPDDLDEYNFPLDGCEENLSDHLGEQTVYQKVSNWVLSQRRFFLNIETTIFEDDDIEMIDPVDLFHERILNEYFLITENDCERRSVFRELKCTHYEIESIEEAMQTFEYKFLREPERCIEIELVPLITFHEFYQKTNRKRKMSASSSVYAEQEEEALAFLGVPRLLENYVILNREGDVIITDHDTDLWLSPLQEDVHIDDNFADEHEEIEFLSSWFSDVSRGGDTDENRTLITDKVTVISVGPSDEEVWVDAPEIPHWLDDDSEHEELELFNQPSRPLYYYRDRIKGCYRIIGVEDETVVLFSGNDDDNIFYNENEDFFSTNGGALSAPKVVQACNESSGRQYDVNFVVDHKNDSGIEDIDDLITEEVAVASLSLSKHEIENYLPYNSPHAIKNTRHVAKHLCGPLMVGCGAVLILILAFYLQLMPCNVESTFELCNNFADLFQKFLESKKEKE